MFLNGAIYIVASVLLQGRSQELKAEQVGLDIALPEIVREVAVDGVKSLQWFTLSSEVSSDSAIQVEGVADHFPEPLPPTNIVVTNTKIGQSVVMRWEPANGQTLTGVEIYRSTVEPEKPLQDMELLATVEQSTGEYIDETVTDDTTYYYGLRSYRVLDATDTVAADATTSDALAILYSALSDIYTVIPTDETAPRGPRWIQVTQHDSRTETGLLLSWDAVVDADITKLNIYRSNEPGAVGTKIQSVTPDVTELIDTTVEPAVNYYYTITAIDAAENESSQTLYISRYGNGSPFVASEAEASERIKNGNWFCYIGYRTAAGTTIVVGGTSGRATTSSGDSVKPVDLAGRAPFCNGWTAG